MERAISTKENQIYSRDSHKERKSAKSDGLNTEFLCDLGSSRGRQSRSRMESMSKLASVGLWKGQQIVGHKLLKKPY